MMRQLAGVSTVKGFCTAKKLRVDMKIENCFRLLASVMFEKPIPEI